MRVKLRNTFRLSQSSRFSGFTLVELLVVIGIIALLIGILLPSLATARRAAQRTACAVKLQQIMLAAQSHANAHQGYYPLVGILGHLDPVSLGDSRAARYDYYAFQAYPTSYLLAPITLALSREMTTGSTLTTVDDVGFASLAKDPNGYIRNFLCPAQAMGNGGLPAATAVYSGSIDAYDVFSMQSQSYVFNEQVMGIDDAFGALRGKAGAVRQTSRTMFAADGLGGSANNNRFTSWEASDAAADGSASMATIYSNTTTPISLGDCMRGLVVNGRVIGGDVQSFDRLRHHGKINVAFCDGHVESCDISAKSLGSVYIMAP